MAEQPGPETRAASRSRANKLWYLLLIVPFIALLWVSSYNSVEPSLAGFPFFYWYQFLWVILGAALTAAVYFATK